VSVRHFLASNKMIDLVHNAKLFITVWTVDKKRLALKYRKLGVDFITSNDIYLLD
jgi:glycerophosphoryl diester phosphodiesterase